MSPSIKKKSLPPELRDWPHFIIQSVPSSIITVDGQMHITDINRAAEELTGFTREEALGRFCGEILRSNLCSRECPLKMAMGSDEIVSREASLENRRALFVTSSIERAQTMFSANRDATGGQGSRLFLFADGASLTGGDILGHPVLNGRGEEVRLLD